MHPARHRFLDFLKACHERSPHAGGPALGAARPTFQRCLDAPSLLRYVAWRGLWLALTGLAATAFSGLRMARQSMRAGDEKTRLDPLADSSASALSSTNADQPCFDNQTPLVTASPPPVLMPFETFGIPVVRALGLKPLFVGYERLLLSVVERVNVTSLVQLTCLPGGSVDHSPHVASTVSSCRLGSLSVSLSTRDHTTAYVFPPAQR